MNKLLTGGICFLLIFAGILIMGCKNEPEGNTDETTVAFNELGADGSTTVTTTKLTLKFNKDISGLAVTDVTLNAGTTGAGKGALTRTGTGVYELAVSGVMVSGNVTLTVSKSGFTITGSPQSVNIFRNPSAGVKVSTWKGLTAPPATNATQYGTHQGKTDVLHLVPADTAFDWAALTYSLDAYAGKEITITLSMDVWLETASKIAWQANLGSSFPLIAGNNMVNQTAGQWVTISGNNKITVPSGGGILYLSNDATYGLNNAKVYITNFVMDIDDGGGAGQGGKTLTLTIGAKENLTGRITTFNPDGRTLTWSSSNNSVATVNTSGIVTAAGFTTGGTSTASSAATGTATITVRADGATPNTDSFTINTTMESQINMMNLTPLKDQFADYFLLGNITRSNGDIGGGTISNTRLTRHYNVLTAENDMKPSYYGGSRSGTTVTGLTFNQADTFVNAATASGFKVHAHVLLWHSQNSVWINALNGSTGKETAIGAMKSYINQVVTHYKGKIYSWDVLNEVFPDGVSSSANWKTSMRTTGDSQAPNPWFVAIGSDFVFEGFKAARLADPNAILYYNDYNMDSPGKATMVHNMVGDVNLQWKGDPQYDNRLLIEGIGMQSHHNTNVSADSIKNSLDMFRLLGVRISISELDVLSQSYSEYSSKASPTNSQKLTAANLYGQYFKLFIDNADIIERVTFWGVYDEQSWRSSGLPLIFEGTTISKAKPAYYKVIGALE
jgi:GH35 family endo-1,4-beta-xylanase